MSRAVEFDGYGDIDVLQVRDVPRPVPGDGEVLVEVKAAGINPGEAMIRKGVLHDRWPATFPSGQGSDLAGVVAELGSGVTGFAVGDEVIGFSERRNSQAEYVSVPAGQLTAKPAGLSWEVLRRERSVRLLGLSSALRKAVGPDYPLGAIIPSPRGMQLRPDYWPRFPYEGLARTYDVFMPMGYFTYR